MLQRAQGWGQRSVVVGRGQGRWGSECGRWGVGAQGRRPGLGTMYWSGLRLHVVGCGLWVGCSQVPLSICNHRPSNDHVIHADSAQRQHAHTHAHSLKRGFAMRSCRVLCRSVDRSDSHSVIERLPAVRTQDNFVNSTFFPVHYITCVHSTVSVVGLWHFTATYRSLRSHTMSQ